MVWSSIIEDGPKLRPSQLVNDVWTIRIVKRRVGLEESATAFFITLTMLRMAQFRTWAEGAASSLSWPAVVAVVLVLYISLCSFLRFRQLSKIRSRHKFPDRESVSRMTGTEAQAIIESAYTYEFPLFFGLSLTYALFKVCP
jgi:hypothetical protein